jgi:hypothetical protein
MLVLLIDFHQFLQIQLHHIVELLIYKINSQHKNILLIIYKIKFKVQ